MPCGGQVQGPLAGPFLRGEASSPLPATRVFLPAGPHMAKKTLEEGQALPAEPLGLCWKWPRTPEDMPGCWGPRPAGGQLVSEACLLCGLFQMEEGT